MNFFRKHQIFESHYDHRIARLIGSSFLLSSFFDNMDLTENFKHRGANVGRRLLGNHVNKFFITFLSDDDFHQYVGPPNETKRQ